jgi:DNA-binding transcriptional ArsR family regulator
LSRKTPKERLEDLEAVMNALAHPARRQILLTVHFRGGSMTAGEIAGRFAHTWATTTGHIRILESARLLDQQKIGRVRHYRINGERLKVLEEWLSWFKKKVIDSEDSGETEAHVAISGPTKLKTLYKQSK